MSYIDYFEDDLKTSVVVVQSSETSDGMGGQTINESTVATFTAAVWQNSVNELIDSDRQSDISTYTLAGDPTDLTSVEPYHYILINNKKYKMTKSNDIMDKEDLTTLEMELIS